jgi:4-methylaminobutanoate oxidase (formaldehyde-forming)
VTYVGELGWELYPPTEFGLRLWDVVLEAGRPFGLVPAGYRAIDSLRLEKGYRAWGADITPEETPLEAGLRFAVKLDKGEFTGREALRQAAADPERRLSCLVLSDPRSVALGNEPVFADGNVVGRVTSGGVGYAIGKSIAFAYVPTDMASAGTSLAVEVFGARVDAEVVPDPLYDPTGERIRS